MANAAQTRQGLVILLPFMTHIIVRIYFRCGGGGRVCEFAHDLSTPKRTCLRSKVATDRHRGEIVRRQCGHAFEDFMGVVQGQARHGFPPLTRTRSDSSVRRSTSSITSWLSSRSWTASRRLCNTCAAPRMPASGPRTSWAKPRSASARSCAPRDRRCCTARVRIEAKPAAGCTEHTARACCWLPCAAASQRACGRPDIQSRPTPPVQIVIRKLLTRRHSVV